MSENRENLTNTTRTFFQTRRVMCVYSGGMDRVFILVIQLKLEVHRKYSERPTFTLTCGNIGPTALKVEKINATSFER